MRNRRSVVIAIALTGAATLSMAQGRQGGAGRGRAPAARPDRIAGRPNLNGIWQAINTANWNLEGHSAAPTAFPQLGALFSIPAGLSVIVDNNGTIPYTPEGLKKRQENQAGWPKSDPEAKCYMAGLPRATYMPYPFQIVQGETDILFLYEYAGANRAVHMVNHTESPIDSWMGWSNGRWDGDTLAIEVKGFTDSSWFDRAGNHHSDALTVTERYTLGAGGNHLNYEARIEDPKTFIRPWTIRMPLYRRLDANVQLLPYNCVEFSEELLYGDVKRKPSK